MIAPYVNTVKMPVYRGDAQTGRHVVAGPDTLREMIKLCKGG